MQGCMAFLRRKRQKTGRSELLPVVFVQFLLSGVRLRQPEQRAEEKKQRCRGSAAATQPRQYHAGGGQNNAGDQNCQTQAEQHPDERVHPGRTAPWPQTRDHAQRLQQRPRQRAQQQRLGYEHGRQRHHVSALVLPEADCVQVCPQPGQHECDGPRDAQPAQCRPADGGGRRLVQQLRELDTEGAAAASRRPGGSGRSRNSIWSAASCARPAPDRPASDAGARGRGGCWPQCRAWCSPRPKHTMCGRDLSRKDSLRA